MEGAGGSAETRRLGRGFFLRLYALAIVVIAAVFATYRWERSRTRRAAEEHWRQAIRAVAPTLPGPMLTDLEKRTDDGASRLQTRLDACFHGSADWRAPIADVLRDLERRAERLERDGDAVGAARLRARVSDWVASGGGADRLEELSDERPRGEGELSGWIAESPEHLALVRLQHLHEDGFASLLDELELLDEPEPATLPAGGPAIESEMEWRGVARFLEWLESATALARTDGDAAALTRCLLRQLTLARWFEESGELERCMYASAPLRDVLAELRELDPGILTHEQVTLLLRGMESLEPLPALGRAIRGERLDFLAGLARAGEARSGEPLAVIDWIPSIEAEELEASAGWLEQSLALEQELAGAWCEAASVAGVASVVGAGHASGGFSLLGMRMGTVSMIDSHGVLTAASSDVRSSALLGLQRVRLHAHLHGVAAAMALAQTLRDPYDGQPLRARLEPDGALLAWSVGEDCSDDGGSVGATGTDLGIRIGGE